MQESDRRLVLRARLGDRDAYGKLVARHQGRVRGWLRHLCRDHAEADDLAQDAFVRAWARIDSLKDTSRFAPWLMKIAYNEFLQERRSRKRRDELMERFAAEGGSIPRKRAVRRAGKRLGTAARAIHPVQARARRRRPELCLRLFARGGKPIDRTSPGNSQVTDPPRQPKGTGAVR